MRAQETYQNYCRLQLTQANTFLTNEEKNISTKPENNYFAPDERRERERETERERNAANIAKAYNGCSRMVRAFQFLC